MQRWTRSTGFNRSDDSKIAAVHIAVCADDDAEISSIRLAVLDCTSDLLDLIGDE